MERKATYPIEFVFEQLGDDIFHEDERYKSKPFFKEFDGDVIKANSQRYQTFKTYGTTCCKCGLKATFFAKEKPEGAAKWHLNLYGVDKNGEEVLFTKDHIIPKSKGGPSKLSNYQTMCTRCNRAKSDKMPETLNVSQN